MRKYFNTNKTTTPSFSQVHGLISLHCSQSDGPQRPAPYLRPTAFILAAAIRTCIQQPALHGGASVHAVALKSGHHVDIYVGSSLVHMYCKTGFLKDARKVFDNLPFINAVTSATLISGYVHGCRSRDAIDLVRLLTESGRILGDPFVVSAVISAFTDLGHVKGGEQVHAMALRDGAEKDPSVGNGLLYLYLRCWRTRSATVLFDQMVVRDLVSWTTMVSGLVHNSLHREALAYFGYMCAYGFRPDEYTCTSVLTSIGSLRDLVEGVRVHGLVVQMGVESDRFVNSALVAMYSKCDSLTDAKRCLDGRNVVSYNTIIGAYSRYEDVVEVLGLFREMLRASIRPNEVTLIGLLGASALSEPPEIVTQIHGVVLRVGLQSDVLVGSALIEVYSRISSVVEGRAVFDEMAKRDVVVWNTMLSGYVKAGAHEVVLRLYSEMATDADEFTYVSVLTTCGGIPSILLGREVHDLVLKIGLHPNKFVSNALVDMYAKCGVVVEARKVFDESDGRDVSCWNSMISSYARHGEAAEALRLFKDMTEKKGIIPNYVTFVGLLSACAHTGLVEDGLRVFGSMHEFGVEPGTEHYTSVVSLLGRAGRAAEAKEMVEKMTETHEPSVWRSLLHGCRESGHIGLGRYAMEKAISNHRGDGGPYILFSNILASKGMWGEVKGVREAMELRGAAKEVGRSWIEIDRIFHFFVSNDIRRHVVMDLVRYVLYPLGEHIRDLKI